jgi:hypothetical protein
LPQAHQGDGSNTAAQGQAKGEHLGGWTVLQGLLMFYQPGLDSGFGC